MKFIQKLTIQGLLSFPDNMEAFELLPLNILIGPNGSGKSNVLEVLELLRATPTDFASAIRDGGGASEWIWKGGESRNTAKVEIITGDKSTFPRTPTGRPLRYRLEFTHANSRVEVLDEAIEEVKPVSGEVDPYFYYRFQRGHPVINVVGGTSRKLKREDLLPDQSVLAQRREPELYPEVTWIGNTFGKIHLFRDWTFGRYAPLRQPQPADLPEDRLLPDYSNLALFLNQFEFRSHERARFNELMKRFLPGFERMSTNISGGRVQFYLHEPGLVLPIPPTRLSDGTIRFIAIIATLLAPEPPPLVCIEEPELGMHPDAVALIGDLLIEASQRMQLIVTTHSETLVSAMSNQPESVVACERLGASTALHRLDPETLNEWLETYTLGDLWRKGDLGANP